MRQSYLSTSNSHWGAREHVATVRASYRLVVFGHEEEENRTHHGVRSLLDLLGSLRGECCHQIAGVDSFQSDYVEGQGGCADQRDRHYHQCQFQDTDGRIVREQWMALGWIGQQDNALHPRGCHGRT